MSKNFDQAFTDLLGHEGGYSNNPADPGGETNWGITVAVARENGYVGPMKDMGASVAKAIYAKKYWLTEFDQLPYPVAFQIFDAAVNSGVGQAVRWLQRSVGTADDGKIGPVTLAAASATDPLKLVLLFNSERLMFMTNLSTWGSFGKGWARRVATNLKKGAA
jgi:lysozyme family protein